MRNLVLKLSMVSLVIISGFLIFWNPDRRPATDSLVQTDQDHALGSPEELPEKRRPTESDLTQSDGSGSLLSQENILSLLTEKFDLKKREINLKILQASSQEEREILLKSLRDVERDQWNEVTALMPPAELLEYRINNSWLGRTLKSDLASIDVNQQQLEALFKSKEFYYNNLDSKYNGSEFSKISTEIGILKNPEADKSAIEYLKTEATLRKQAEDLFGTELWNEYANQVSPMNQFLNSYDYNKNQITMNSEVREELIALAQSAYQMDWSETSQGNLNQMELLKSRINSILEDSPELVSEIVQNSSLLLGIDIGDGYLDFQREYINDMLARDEREDYYKNLAANHSIEEQAEILWESKFQTEASLGEFKDMEGLINELSLINRVPRDQIADILINSAIHTDK